MLSKINHVVRDLIYRHSQFTRTGDIPKLVYFFSIIYNGFVFGSSFNIQRLVKRKVKIK